MNLLRIEEQLSTAHLRLAGTFVERLHWKTCIERYDRPHTFFYLDPPYWETEGYGVPFPFEEYEAIAHAFRTLKGKAMMSINDHPDIRRCFEGMHMESLDISYTVGGGGKAVDRRELVIGHGIRYWSPAGCFDRALKSNGLPSTVSEVNRTAPIAPGLVGFGG